MEDEEQHNYDHVNFNDHFMDTSRNPPTNNEQKTSFIILYHSNVHS